MTSFEGIWIPLVTPFRDGAVDYAAAHRLADRYAAHVHGLVVCGTTGEAATLSDEEQERLLATVSAAAGARCPVAMGLSGNDTAAVAAAARRLEAHATAFLVTAPYYVRPSPEGVRRHFEAVAAATRRPIILYNIPYRTGVNIDVATVRALAANPQFVAIKESGGDLPQLMDLLRDTPLKVLCGEDALILTACALGAHGAVAAAAHVRPELFVAMYEELRAGALPAARALHNRLLPIVRLLFSEPNPGPIKAALAAQGWIADELRLPMTRASAACRAQLQAALALLETQ